MIFNLEPAIYVSGFGGIRQCEMVLVTESGAELLTAFQNDPEQLVIPSREMRHDDQSGQLAAASRNRSKYDQ